jgi:hypothetical protein
MINRHLNRFVKRDFTVSANKNAAQAEILYMAENDIVVISYGSPDRIFYPNEISLV